ncbi:helix-turn-helix transcriptional regulator [Staphylococcus hominis]|uniref:helix-turn-helix transcriptional regulator n=1 Tax=Staphylococcus hominis TaxID=1290 RepID=UPI00019FC371|nr:helix-turn-helix transcriptional regulator [Staphylococcus hominis]EEK12791.1 DNA-binding helix-turn-helix protein [Staphylococcus hominis SK119]MDS3840576.1 helix-turn-helix transcriptional regulator [Staphylococcus hominis]MDS3855022.1 helix-turn-helix transcriptional regulator [Staphylococcus hominis]MDS3858452.1 helix-turn-helix transcriptional regulator [Staphylococcus hominis]MDS3882278.1 helix-turn-helix transcriptional regulator [Staphylococcus hominis]
MPENKPSQLGLIIKNIRKSKNMTQSKLSEKTGFSQNTISNHENGRRSIGEKEVEKYAKALEVTKKSIYNHLEDISTNDFNITKVEFGKMVNKILDQENYDIDSLIKSTKLSKPQFQSVLNGYIGEIPIHKLTALCEFLNISPSYIFKHNNVTEHTYEEYVKARQMFDFIENHYLDLPFKSKEAIYNYVLFEVDKAEKEKE